MSIMDGGFEERSSVGQAVGHRGKGGRVRTLAADGDAHLRRSGAQFRKGREITRQHACDPRRRSVPVAQILAHYRRQRYHDAVFDDVQAARFTIIVPRTEVESPRTDGAGDVDLGGQSRRVRFRLRVGEKRCWVAQRTEVITVAYTGLASCDAGQRIVAQSPEEKADLGDIVPSFGAADSPHVYRVAYDVEGSV